MHRGFPMEASAPKKKRPLAAIPEGEWLCIACTWRARVGGFY